MPLVEYGEIAIEQLADFGLPPDDMDMFVRTHFDRRHVRPHRTFAKAELIVQREHDELARGGHPRLAA